jgi:hypothetical protein
MLDDIGFRFFDIFKKGIDTFDELFGKDWSFTYFLMI